MPIKHIGKSSIERIAETKKMLNNLPVQVANIGLNHFLNNFKTESWEGRKWKKRSGWSHRDTGGAILDDVGTLKRALTKVASGSTARVFVAAPADKYADIHNFGGTIKIRPTAKLIKWCWAMYYKSGFGTEKSRYKAMALKLQSGNSIIINMPKRQFIGESKILNEKIEKKIQTSLHKTWNEN